MSGLKLGMREDLEQRYNKLRITALKTSNTVIEDKSIELKLVDSYTYEAFKSWDKNQNRIKDWDWPHTLQEWKFKHPKRFEAAAWKNGRLAGLALGKPTYAATGLRLDYIEKAPSTDINLVETMLIALTTYGTILGANHLKIMSPVNTAVRDYYISFGFKYISKEDCCIRRLL
jgi:hypothetical protein